MISLYYGNLIRTETDFFIISNLKRKGWKELPPSPEFDSETHVAQWVNGNWQINSIPKPIPEEVPLWALRSILLLAELQAPVVALINALPEPQKIVATQQYEYGNFIKRNHPLVSSFSSYLNLSEDFVDNIFISASLLT